MTSSQLTAAVQADSDEEKKSRPKFGNRHLDQIERVWDHNAWDDVEWDEEQMREAKAKIELQARHAVSPAHREKLEEEASKYWDIFYSKHDNRFFKDRHWLFTEFPELLTTGKERKCVLELGCGVGNTVFPLLKADTDKVLFVSACDISPTAIDILKKQEDFDSSRCNAFVHDLASTTALPIGPASQDVVTSIFVLSALEPAKISIAVAKIAKVLKPGGVLLFRDYGQYDLAQLRFKKDRLLDDDFYVRGDGTRVKFFTKEEIDAQFTAQGLVNIECIYDKRLLVNRKRGLKMYRVWVQAKYRKPMDDQCLTPVTNDAQPDIE